MAAAAGIVEGATRLFPPEGNLGRKTKAPGTKTKGQPFFNPGMDLNRDLSVLLVEAEAKRREREIDVADALAGTGARALRLAHEVIAPIIVHANDADPTAVAAMRQGAEANKVPPGRLSLRHGDAHAFLASRRFDVVDVDPYGSPMPFIDAAMRATRHDGLICVTATDTGALAGAYPKACRRRYDAHHGLNAAPWRSEVGLRIMAGAVVRSAARFDREALPVLSVSHGHWMRVVARVEDRKRDADAALKRLANATWDPQTSLGRFMAQGEAPPSARQGWAGPMWSGALHDATFVAAMLDAAAGKTLAATRETLPLLALLSAEADAPAFWVVPDHMQSRFGPPSPRRERYIERLLAAGHKATRTHLDPQGIRTDADEDGLRRAWTAPRPDRLPP